MYIHVQVLWYCCRKPSCNNLLQILGANCQLASVRCQLGLKFELKVSDLVTMPEDATSRLQLHDDSPRPHVYEGQTTSYHSYCYSSIFGLTSCISTTTRESTGKDRWPATLQLCSRLAPAYQHSFHHKRHKEALMLRLTDAYPSQSPHLDLFSRAHSLTISVSCDCGERTRICVFILYLSEQDYC